MLHVSIVSSSAGVREGLRRLLEGAAAEVVQGDATADVVVFGDGRDLLDWRSGGEVHRPAVVVLARRDMPEVASLLRTLDLRGWAVMRAGAGADELWAAVVGADAGFAIMPADVVAAGTGGDAGATRPFGDRSPIPASPGTEDEAPQAETLTPRELEVLELLGRGLSNREIGARLGISEHTAKFHVASVLAKLGAANRADAVRRGLRRGLLPL